MQEILSLAELNDLAGAGKLKGLFRLSNDLYHEGPGISSTGLKEILKSPAHYQASRVDRGGDSAALRFGRLVHMRLLEPELFNVMVVVRPTVDGRTKDGKAANEAFAAKSVGKEVITQSEADALDVIAVAAAKNKLASSILGKGMAEVSVYWTDEATGVLCKARADLIRGEAIFDLKTCYSAQPREFQKAVASYQYHLSAAFYLDGFETVLPVKNFAWVALEKSPPHCFGFYAADQETIALGRSEYRRALETYAECEKSGEWPGYLESFVNLTLTGA